MVHLSIKDCNPSNYAVLFSLFILVNLFLERFHSIVIIFIFVSSEDTVMKERVWSLISQNEPSIVPISVVSSN